MLQNYTLKNNKLTIVTSSKRQKNIPILLESIIKEKNDNVFWNILFDLDYIDDDITKILSDHKNWISFNLNKDEKNLVGGGNYNKHLLINAIDDGWIYQLDDDNILYPNFIKEIYEIILNNPKLNLICFRQKNNFKPKIKEDLKCGKVDTAMYLFHKEITHNIEYPLIHGGDGYYLENLIKTPKTELLILNKDLCYYNYIKNSEFFHWPNKRFKKIK